MLKQGYHGSVAQTVQITNLFHGMHGTRIGFGQIHTTTETDIISTAIITLEMGVLVIHGHTLGELLLCIGEKDLVGGGMFSDTIGDGHRRQALIF